MSASSSVADKTAVLAQLDRILASAAFRNSKRYCSFLRHVVERTLAGSAADLKERTLGVEVFGRLPEYDNYSDPVVRMAAGEIRKRIARYYHEPGRERELRIELPLGSYVPEFVDPVVALEEPAVTHELVRITSEPRARRSRRLLPVVLALGLLGALVLWWRPWVRSGTFEQFWGPFLDRGSPVTICVARITLPTPPATPGATVGRFGFMAWSDTVASTKVASVITAAGHRYQLKRDDDVTFEDLRRGPAVLIGGFNDVWTLRLTENLRFEFQNDGSSMWILDRQNAASRTWSSDYSRSAPASRDYAVISRLLNSRSGRPVLTIAGIRSFGTEIAGEFVTNRSLLDSLAGKAPAGWQRRNMQILLETEVIDGHAGPPKIQAIHVW